jgi:hypothetical protein
MNATYDEIATRRLMKWIDSHEPRPEPTIDNKDGTLTVSTACVYPGGAIRTVTDVIPATMQAARDLLGY